MDSQDLGWRPLQYERAVEMTLCSGARSVRLSVDGSKLLRNLRRSQFSDPFPDASQGAFEIKARRKPY